MLMSSCASVKDIVVVEKKPPRVSVKAYPLDLVYGPALTPQEAVEATEFALQSAGLEFEEITFPEISFNSSGGAEPPPDPCPPPSQDAIVEPIALDVSKALSNGVYPWRQEGTLEVVGLFKVPIKGPTVRTIRNVTVEEDGAFSYEYESFVGIRRQILHLRVVPSDGIFLTYLKVVAGAGTHEFRPLLPVEIFPLPSSAGTVIGPSVGVDPVTRELMQVNGNVSKKERYEGCGEAFDAWLAETTWTFQNPEGTEVPWDFDFAVSPQLGGLIVFEHLKVTEFFSTNPPLTIKTDMNSTLSSVTPTPER